MDGVLGDFYALYHFVCHRIHNIRCLEPFFSHSMTTLKFGGIGFRTGSTAETLSYLNYFLFSAFLKCQRMFFEEILFWYAKTSEGCQSGLEGFIFSFNAFLSGKGNTAYPMAIDFNSQTHWHSWNINDDKEEGGKG